MHFSSSTGDAGANGAWEWQFPRSCVAESRPQFWRAATGGRSVRQRRGATIGVWAHSGVNIGGSNWRTTQQGILNLFDPCALVQNIPTLDVFGGCGWLVVCMPTVFPSSLHETKWAVISLVKISLIERAQSLRLTRIPSDDVLMQGLCVLIQAWMKSLFAANTPSRCCPSIFLSQFSRSFGGAISPVLVIRSNQYH